MSIDENSIYKRSTSIIENKDIKTPYINSNTILTTVNKAFEDFTIKWYVKLTLLILNND